MIDPAMIINWISYFILYSFLGWVVEVFHAYYKRKIWVNRGFLKIPFCPVYGFGGLLVNGVLLRLQDSYLGLFLSAVIIITLLEYGTGFLLEKFFGAKWWNYEEEKWNLKGYICPKYSFLFSLLTVVTVKIIHPIISEGVQRVDLFYRQSFVWFFSALILLDFFRTIGEINDFYQYLRELQRRIEDFSTVRLKERLLKEKQETMSKMENQMDEIENLLAEIRDRTAELKAEYEVLLREGTRKYGRLLRAFPKFKPLKFQKSFQRLKERFKGLKKPLD